MDSTLILLDSIIKKLDKLEKKIEEINNNRPTESNNKVYTVEEMREFLKVGKNTAYELIRTGKIKSFKVGAEYRIAADAINEYIKNTALHDKEVC